jgi:lysophospholipid acyltransferase (LPLAT)-like uncharacterized protein
VDQVKAWWRRVRPGVVSGVAYFLIRLIGMTLRLRHETLGQPQPAGEGRVIVGWHGRSFIPVVGWRGRGYYVMISQSRDGEIQNYIFRRYGFHTVRGSTRRGGARAAVEAIRVLRSGASLAITPDGPRGPRGVVQKGALTIAQKAGVPLVAVGVSSTPRIVFNSWDHYLLPLPFGRAMIVLGEPIYIPKDADDEELERLRQEVQESMHDAERRAEQALGVRPKPSESSLPDPGAASP